MDQNYFEVLGKNVGGQLEIIVRTSLKDLRKKEVGISQEIVKTYLGRGYTQVTIIGKKDEKGGVRQEIYTVL